MIVDYENWTMDLEKANKVGTPEWVRAESPKKLYNMKSLTPTDWDDLIERMAKNITLFDIYFR